MPHHEEKHCPRCQALFECKLGSINLCQCTKISLNDAERDYISSQFEDCLCAKCLLELQKEYKQKQFEAEVNRAFAFFNLKFLFKE